MGAGALKGLLHHRDGKKGAEKEPEGVPFLAEKEMCFHEEWVIGLGKGVGRMDGERDREGISFFFHHTLLLGNR